jgi:hypothetical protein
MSDSDLEIYNKLTKYSLADFFAWIGFHAGHGKWSDSTEVQCAVRLVREYIESRKELES